jgi:hypothetical protein
LVARSQSHSAKMMTIVTIRSQQWKSGDIEFTIRKGNKISHPLRTTGEHLRIIQG